MAGLDNKPVEPAKPAEVANAIGRVLDSYGDSGGRPSLLLVSLSAMQTLASMPQQFGLQRAPDGGILLAGIPLEVSRHIPENSSVLALGVS